MLVLLPPEVLFLPDEAAYATERVRRIDRETFRVCVNDDDDDDDDRRETETLRESYLSLCQLAMHSFKSEAVATLSATIETIGSYRNALARGTTTQQKAMTAPGTDCISLLL